MSQIVVPPHSRKEIESFATKLREAFLPDNRFYVPILQIMELILPQIDDSFNFYTVDDLDFNLNKNEYAKYFPESNELLVKDSVYAAAYKGNCRQRFTLAHELGHYLLHRNVVSFSRCNDEICVPKYMDPEWQADVFAGAFLIPKSKILYMSIYEISERCGVSLEAAQIALSNKSKKS